MCNGYFWGTCSFLKGNRSGESGEGVRKERLGGMEGQDVLKHKIKNKKQIFTKNK